MVYNFNYRKGVRTEEELKMNANEAREALRLQKQVEDIERILDNTKGSPVKLRRSWGRTFIKGSGLYMQEQEIDWYLWERIRKFLEDERERIWEEIEKI